MSREKTNRTLRIRKRLVAITSVLLALTLMTTISFSMAFPVFAEGEDGAVTQTEDKEKDKEKSESDNKGSDNKDTKKKDDKKKDDKQKDDAEKSDKDKEKAADGEKAEGATEDAEEPVEEDITTQLDYSRTATKPDVSATSYVVMSGSTSEMVIEHHAQRKMSPGRITMLMTAMIVLDNMHNDKELENTVDINKAIAEFGDSFKSGDSIKVGDLLDAMLIGGSEEAAEALSRYSASKRKIFIKMMNSKAMELGLMDTQFVNPTGAYSTKQYSTATDCAKITQAAIRYQKIQEIFEKSKVEFEVTGKDGARVVGFRSTNPLLVSNKPSGLYKYTKGGISGAVGEPVKGSQYAGIATVDDMQLIVVLMDSKAETLAGEAKGLFEYGDTKVTKQVYVKANEKVGVAKVRGGEKTKIPVYTATKGFVYVPPEGSEDLISDEVYIYSDLEAPLTDGDKVGEYRIYVADELKGTVDLIIKKSVNPGWFPSRYYISNVATIVIGAVLFLILLLVARILYVKWRKRKMREARRARRLEEIARQQMEIDEDRKRRNWTYTSSYEKVAPRTGDLRKETSELESSRQDNRKKRATRAEKRKAAKAKKTGTVDKATRTVITDRPEDGSDT